jgi:hypothetical protein
MRIIVKLDNVDITNRVLLNKTSLNKATNNRSGNASISVIASSSDVALYDAALYDSAVYDSSVSSEYTNKIVTIETASTNELIYKGIVTDVEIKVIKPIEHLYDLKLKEYSTILDEVLVVSESYSSKTNEFIIDDIFASYLPSVDTTNVQNLFTLANYQIKDKTIKAVLDELAKLTNGVWWLTADDELFFTSILYAPVAPYKLTSNSTDPDYFKAFNLDIKKNTKDFANRVIVLGGVDIDGDEVRAEANNTTSQTNLGKIVEKVIVNREITITAIAELLADAELDNRVLTQIYGSFDTMQAGFEVGQVLTVYQPSHAVNQDVLITGIDYTWIEPDKVRYKITFGPKPVFADVVNKLLGKDSKMVSTAIPDGSITASKIASVNASAIQGTVTASQVGSVNASVIQGTVVADQIGSVNATVIQGVIVSSQVADGIINDLSKYSDALRPIPILAAAPSLPSANYPVNSFYYNSTDSTFYKNIAGVWTATTENDAVSGKFDLYHIGTIKAERINGLIVSTQIGSVNATAINGSITSSQITSLAADKITGSLVASQISTVNAASIQGTIQAAQIATVNASAITGTIAASQIATVNASSIQGQISAAQISTVNASSISGQINSTQISSVSASAITGTIAAYQIAGIDATQITGSIQSSQITNIAASKIDGLIQSSQIDTIAATKITGTISASQIGTVNASAITGSISASQIGTVNASAITGGITATQITNVYGNVVTSSVSNPFGGIYCTGTITIASPGSLYIDNGELTVNGTFGNSGGITCKHFTQTGSNVSISNPTNWRNAIGAAATSHTHAQSEITNLVTDLGNKSSSTHTHTATVTLSVTTANANIQDYSGNWHNFDYVTGVTVQSVSISQPV